MPKFVNYVRTCRLFYKRLNATRKQIIGDIYGRGEVSLRTTCFRRKVFVEELKKENKKGSLKKPPVLLYPL